MIATLAHLFTSGAYLPFALLLIYAGLRLVKDETHWLNQGRIAVIAAAVLAGLTQLVPILVTGSTPSLQAVAAALGTAWALYISPHPVTVATAPASSQRGSIGRRLMVLMAFVAVAGLASCAWWSTNGKPALKAIGKCAEIAAVNEITPAVKSVLENGADNWRDQLKALGIAYGEDALACAVEDAGKFFAAKQGGSDAPAVQAASRAQTWLSEHHYK